MRGQLVKTNPKNRANSSGSRDIHQVFQIFGLPPDSGSPRGMASGDVYDIVMELKKHSAEEHVAK